MGIRGMYCATAAAFSSAAVTAAAKATGAAVAAVDVREFSGHVVDIRVDDDPDG